MGCDRTEVDEVLQVFRQPRTAEVPDLDTQTQLSETQWPLGQLFDSDLAPPVACSGVIVEQKCPWKKVAVRHFRTNCRFAFSI